MAVVVMRDPITGKNFNGIAGKRLFLFGENIGSMSFSAPFAPKVVDYNGFVQDWVTVERPGGKPLLLRKQESLETLSFTVMIGEQDRQASQIAEVLALKQLARTRERVLVRYSSTEAGLWRITELSFSSEERADADNEITRMTASFTLTEASDPAPSVGPVTGGATGGGGGGAGAAPPAPAQQVHTVVGGDTLWGISARYYGDGTQWPRVFDANRDKIEDPHWIFPGQEFVIP